MNDKSGGGVYVGIDLGTNNSCIAVYKLEKADVIASQDGSRITPSYVYMGEAESDIHVGKSALNNGNKYPERLLYDSKRLFGTKANDTLFKNFKNQWTFDTKRDLKTGYGNYKIGDRIFTPERISAEILKKLVSFVDKKDRIDGIVITVPAYFSSEQKKKLMEAAEMANLKVMRLLCEPTAAAIAYGMEHAYINGEILFVFDMGGGTFDITIIKIDNSNDFKIISMGGDSHLGGRDFDWLITDWMEKELIAQVGKIELKARKKFKMMQMAKEAKESLSQAEDAVIQLTEIHGDAKDITLTRRAFENLSQKLLVRIKQIVESSLKCRALEKKQIDHVLFVGGASKMPLISKLLKEFFNEAKFSKTVNAEEIVALGATRLAANLGNQSSRPDIRNLKIADALSLKIGIEIAGNKFYEVFENNCPYGESKIITVTTSEDNQIMCEIAVYEGLRDNLEDNRHIGSIIIRDFPKGKAGEVKVKVRFEIDKNGIISVSATDVKCDVAYETQQQNTESIKNVTKLTF